MTLYESPMTHSLISRIAHLRLLVVGDLVLDEYLIGRVQRLSREAPVPVLEQTRARYVPGGAANPAVNIQSLGGRAVMAGVVGEDAAAAQLRALLTERGVDLTGVITDPARPTSQKTRIVAEGAYVFAHHLARVDRLSRAPVADAEARRLGERITAIMPEVDAVLVSDYRLGVVAPAIVDTVRQQARRHQVLTVVDTQGNLSPFAGFDLLRCNAHEAAAYLGRPLQSDDDFAEALHELVQSLHARAAIITRGEAGLSGLAAGEEVFHLPARNRTQVFDVTGAGDVLIAVATLALAAGLDLRAAAALGNRAAGVAVTRLGNVAVTPADLGFEADA